MKKKTKIIGLGSLGLCLMISLPSYANGIPAYFGTVIFHVLLINMVVMITEWYLFMRFSKLRILPGYIILANLVSLFAAYPFTDFFIHSIQIDQWFGLSKMGTITKPVFLLGAGIFIILTIIIEIPFYYLAAKRKLPFLQACKYAILINLATNLVIALFYIITNSYQPIPD